MRKNTKLIEIKNVSKSFAKQDKQDLLVLNDINFNISEGEIVAILGRSGSGKSTLLRIIAGLTNPSNGSVFYEGEQVGGPVNGIAMVFQSFALMPWLTVLQNVELGLEALGIPAAERRDRALKAIDMIGLDGFESAFPKELSGGMRQRVGLARALVVNPDVLLMDEAFSSLDVLTAENLRTDLMDLWHDHQTNIKAILFVTHKIEEAIAMSDRILIFDSSPGIVKAELPVDLPHPRSEQDKRFVDLTSQIYSIMITPCVEGEAMESSTPHEQIDIGHRLPDIELTELFGLIEAFEVDFKGEKVSLQNLADSQQHLTEEDLLPLIEMLDILHLATLSVGTIELTKIGHQFADADIQEKKQIFSRLLLLHVPLAAYIKRILNENRDHTEKQEVFLTILEEYFSEEEAERVLKAIIDWGRYAEIFAYDADTRVLSLDNP
jgi:NitT/TauT family transport system ATP-binding protein